MNDLISVIVPVYNIENDLLDKCISSIINQTYRNLEIIIVDDGSRKETADECDILAETDSRIIVIHQENKGVSAARNAGLDIAKGDYIGFVDPDDYLDLDMYQVLHDAMLKSGKDISLVSYRVVYSDGKVKNRNYFNEDVIMSKHEALSCLLDDEIITSSVWNKLYKRKLWEHIRFPEEKIFEDCRTAHKLFFASSGVVAVNKTCYNYYQRKDSIMNAKTLDKAAEEIEAWEERLHFVEKNIPEQSYKIKEKIVKLSIKAMMDYRLQLGIKKCVYQNKTQKMHDVLMDGYTKEIIKDMPKYKRRYDFLIKHMYSLTGKLMYSYLGGR